METYAKTRVGVFFGEPGVTVPDPYFAGEGPDRTGCIACARCMVGCPHGAKNTLDKNYLHLATSRGAEIRAMTDRYRAAFKGTHTPMLGLARFVIMAETDAEALTIARRAYPLWHRHFHHLFRMHGTSPAGGDRPPQFDQIKDGGRGIAGSPATVVRMIKAQMQEAGTNYFVAQFAFGDLTLAEVLRTVDLFAREVMPALSSA